MYTFDDFCRIVKDGEKADLIDGVIYMASPDNTDANDIFMWLGNVMFDFAEQTGAGKIYGSRVACRLDEWQGPQPDLLFVRTSRLPLVKRGFVDGGPDLALEIVSPDSIERDYLDKKIKYEGAGVSEYWIVDELKRRLMVYRLDATGKYRKVRPIQGVIRSKAFPGFWLRVSWLWPETRPTALQAVLRLLKHNRGRR
jgi:Uma2 family endonuclease